MKEEPRREEAQGKPDPLGFIAQGGVQTPKGVCRLKESRDLKESATRRTLQPKRSQYQDTLLEKWDSGIND
ncbi:UNVERIFIED_CONTAM: hypothetical protein Slati_1019000 [Sesamum latifolium]|uniref:Uncharacterized protein n=1 Tax=Sesamum latifolium TaxID=2727402 RepID=A0AAW2XS94_9LAMI